MVEQSVKHPLSSLPPPITSYYVYGSSMLPHFIARHCFEMRTKIEKSLSAEQREAFQRWDCFCLGDRCADFRPSFTAAENGSEEEALILSDDSYDLRKLVGARVAEPDDEGANHDARLIQLRVAPGSWGSGSGCTGRGVLFRYAKVVADPDA